MQPTVEVRWFYAGEIPETTLQRFMSGELPQDSGTIEKRRDAYLSFPGMDSLGIKLRGTDQLHVNDADQLEIKRRQLDLPAVTFHTGVTGRLEHWSKWVFHSESSGPQLSAYITAKDEAWVDVRKARYLRKYQVTTDKRVLAVSLKEWPENGCNIEVSELMVPGEKIWWTLGLEAFGDADAVIEDTLRLSANYFFAETALGKFEEKDSYGYPRWLHIVMPFGVKDS
jgi:hypothetical protein